MNDDRIVRRLNVVIVLLSVIGILVAALFSIRFRASN